MTEVVTTRTLPSDHPALAGHFPGHPIFPGAVILDEIRDLVSERWERTVVEIRKAKFHRECPPGAALRIEISCEANGRLRFRGTLDGAAVVTGEAMLEAAPPPR